MLLTLKGLFSQNKNIFSHKIGYEWIEEHNHSFIEFFYVQNGSASHYYNGETVELQRGNAYLLLPNDIHTFMETDSNFIHRDITIRTEYFIAACKQYRRDLYEDLINKKAPVFFNLSNEFIEKIEKRCLFLSLPPDNPVYQETEMYITTEIINLIIEKSNKDSIIFPEWINSLIEDLHNLQNFTIPLSTIISKIPYSKEHIRRTFKHYVGLTLTDFFNDIKLSHAYDLLFHSTRSIASIMEEIGINNTSYFYTLFKAKYNQTPNNTRHGR